MGVPAANQSDQQNPLLEVLGRARPAWSERDRTSALSKLQVIGIDSVTGLAEALEVPLNERLRAAGVRTFTAETLRSLRQELRVERRCEKKTQIVLDRKKAPTGKSEPNLERSTESADADCDILAANSSLDESVREETRGSSVTEKTEQNPVVNCSLDDKPIAPIVTRQAEETNAGAPERPIPLPTETPPRASNSLNSPDCRRTQDAGGLVQMRPHCENDNLCTADPREHSSNLADDAVVACSSGGQSDSVHSAGPSEPKRPAAVLEAYFSDETPAVEEIAQSGNHDTNCAENFEICDLARCNGATAIDIPECPDQWPIGTWLSEDGQICYDIAVQENGDPAALEYCQRVPGSLAVVGEVSRVDQGLCGDWVWQVHLRDDSGLELRREGDRMVSKYRHHAAEEWADPVSSRRQGLFAFFNAYGNPNGFRYVHLGYGSRWNDFPIIGFTAGWLPAEQTSPSDKDLSSSQSGTSRVRFRGIFCDPFEAAPTPAVGSQIRIAPSSGASAPPQVLLLGGGAVLVQTPASNFQPRIPPWAKNGGGKIGGKHPSGWSSGLSALRPFNPPRPPCQKPRPHSPPVDVHQIVASAFRTVRHNLRDHAVFRGRLRQLPRLRQQNDLQVSVPTDSIRRHGTPCRPLLTVFCLRWFDYWSDPEQSSDYSTLNDGFFVDLLNGPCSMGRLIPGEYEVITAFIRCNADLAKIDPHHLRSIAKGLNFVAWYFVWPSTCVAEGDGYVSERDFFSLVRSMENAGIRTGWPHESHLYRQLCGKLWIPKMSHDADFQVPPTARVSFADFRADAVDAAKAAVSQLLELRQRIWSTADVSAEAFRGVAKLGFSWCGSDVLPFQGVASLVTNLEKLFRSSPDETTVCLVQEMVPGVIAEHRIICIYDQVTDTYRRETVWMENMAPSTSMDKYKVQKLDIPEFKVAGSTCVADACVVSQIFRGDASAKTDAETQAMKLSDKWLDWLRSQASRPAQCTRLDFLVAHKSDGRANVWTCEVGECGASLCTVEVHGRNLAALNTAIVSDTTGRFPMPLPKVIPRNSGNKS